MRTIVPSNIPQDKPHYTYVLMYPDDYPELEKAGTVFYVGKGVKDRIHDHEREARKGAKSYKCNVIRKIWDSGCEVDRNILAYFETHEEACIHEIALIFFLPGLTNLTRGGDGIVGLVRTKEHQQKIADARRGQHFTPEQCKKLSEAHKNSVRNAELLRRVNAAKKGKPSWNKGKTMSDEHRRKNSEARKGIPRGPRPEEVVRKVAASNRGKVRTEEQRRRMSDDRRGKPISKPRSEEYKHKLSVANSKKVWQGFIAPDGTRYENIVNLNAFCREHGLSASAMGHVGRGQWNQYKGWRSL